MARWDTIQVEGQPMRVYLDAPAGGGAAPGIVVIQHGPGLDRFMEDRVEDLARHGYVATAPDDVRHGVVDGVRALAAGEAAFPLRLRTEIVLAWRR